VYNASNSDLIVTLEGATNVAPTITGLNPNTEYKFYVRGYDAYGEGQPSDTLTVTTLPKNAADLNVTASIDAGKYTATKIVSFKNNSEFGEGSTSI